jgi:hypothetical protein
VSLHHHYHVVGSARPGGFQISSRDLRIQAYLGRTWSLSNAPFDLGREIRCLCLCIVSLSGRSQVHDDAVHNFDVLSASLASRERFDCASCERPRIEPSCHGHGRFPKLTLRHGARRELLDCSLDRSGTRCVVHRIGRMQIIRVSVHARE